jgi:hypothetical protein
VSALDVMEIDDDYEFESGVRQGLPISCRRPGGSRWTRL